MITETQVVDYLKSKDKVYIDTLIDFLAHPFYFDSEKLYCPRCGSFSCKKNGHDHKGSQRYLCNDCHKSFSEVTGSFFSGTRLSQVQWRSFINYEIAGVTLSEEAYFIGVSVTTAFHMRQKLYRASSEIMSSQKLSGEIEIDGNYQSINLKGTKPENMPRYSKKRGKRAAYSGISHHKVYILCAHDENDHMMMKIAGLGPETADIYRSAAYRFTEVTELISDAKPAIQLFANHFNTVNNRIKPVGGQYKRYVTNDGKSLSRVNELMTSLTHMISRTRGFSTRYAQGYLDFMLFRKQMHYRYKRKDMCNEIISRLKRCRKITDREIADTPLPISLKEAYYEYRYGIFSKSRESAT